MIFEMIGNVSGINTHCHTELREWALPGHIRPHSLVRVRSLLGKVYLRRIAAVTGHGRGPSTVTVRGGVAAILRRDATTVPVSSATYRTIITHSVFLFKENYCIL